MFTFTPAEHLGASDRALGTATRDGRELHVLTVTRRYDATPEEVWDALTDPDRLPRWFLPVSGDLRAGGHYQLEGNAGGEILVCDPPAKLSLTWVVGQQESWVEVALVPEEGRTLLRLEHTLPADEHWAQFGPGAVGLGWELTLMGLAEHLADETFTPPSTPDQMSGLRDFMEAAGDAWMRADVLAGADPEQARAAAARCLAAYTAQPG